MRAVHRSILDAVLQVDPSPVALLDIGCGDGSFTRVLCHYVPNTSITGLDLSLPHNLGGATGMTGAVKVAEAMGRTGMGNVRGAVNTTGIRFVEGTVERLPFPTASFDLVTVSLSMHHWDDKRKGISEVFRVLRPGGCLIIGDPLLQGWLGNPLLGRLAQSIDRGSFASASELEGYLLSSGFATFTISPVPNSFKSTFLITAQKA